MAEETPHPELPKVILPEEVESIIDALPVDKQEQVKALFVGLSIKKSFSGPLPPPDVFRGYENVLPGSAERILKMAENQSEHRMGMESRVTAEEQRQGKRGQHYGLIVALFFLVASFVLVLTGHETSGTIIGM